MFEARTCTLSTAQIALHGLNSHCIRCLQENDEANVLPEADVAMVAKSIAALWEMLIKNHALLLLPFLQNSGLGLLGIVSS